jgi:membrane-associated phospholipid phosphatase
MAVVLVTLAPAADLSAQELATAPAPVQRTDESETERSLVRDIAGDFGAFVTSRDTYLTLGIGLGGSLILRPSDDRVARSHFNHELHPATGLDGVFDPGAVIGGAYVQAGTSLAVYGIGALADRPRVTRLGRDLVRAQLLSNGVTQVLKYSIRRQRPDASNRTSFPSGHSSTTFAMARVLHRHFGWKGVPAYGLAGYVAASRLSENRHYLSDVVFGAAIGLAAGKTVTIDRGATRLAVAPMALPGGGGLQVTITGTE